jgi:hypothetical protein
MPSWFSVVDQSIELAKAKLFNLLKSLDDPKARADLALKEYQDTIIILQRAGVLMNAKEIQIRGFKVKLDSKAKEAHGKAIVAEKSGQHDYAIIYANLQAKLEKQEEFCDDTIANIDQRLKIINSQIIDAQATQDLVEMVIDTEKMRLDVANAEIQYGEAISNVKTHGTNIYNAIKNLQSMREEREARGQALSEMAASGLIDTVTSNIVPTDPARTSNILKQIDDEIKNTKSGADPELLGGRAQ